MGNVNYVLAVCIGVICCTSCANAQPTLKDSSGAYQYWAKRATIEMVYSFMEDYIETVKKPKESAEAKGKDAFYKNYISNIDRKSSGDIDVSYEQLSSFLQQHGWKSLEKNLFAPLDEKYSASLPIDERFFYVMKPNSETESVEIANYKNSRAHWNKKKKEILDSYRQSLAVLARAKEVNKDPSEEENGGGGDHTGIQTAWIIVLVFLGFLAGCAVVYVVSQRQLYSTLRGSKRRNLFVFPYVRRVKEALKKHSIINTGERRKEEIASLKGRVQVLQLEIDSLNKEISLLKKGSAVHEIAGKERDNYSVSIAQPGPAIEPEQATHQSDKITLFFSIPERNGSFIPDKGKQANDGRQLYRIEYVEHSGKGQLFFITELTDKRAINNLDTYLKPVCAIENMSRAGSSTRIELTRPGRVNLINDVWMIDPGEKVKVKLV